MFQLFPPFALVVTGNRSGNTTSDSKSLVFLYFSGSSRGPVWLVVVLPMPTNVDKATYNSRRLMAFMATNPTPVPAFCPYRLPAKIQVRHFHRVTSSRGIERSGGSKRRLSVVRDLGVTSL